MMTSDFLRIFLNGRSLRAACKDITAEQLEEVSYKLIAIIDEKREEERKISAAQAERSEQLASIKAMMLDAGINPSELIGESAPSKRTPKPAKYRYVKDGKEQGWTGQGRMPAPIAKAISQGGKLADFLILGSA